MCFILEVLYPLLKNNESINNIIETTIIVGPEGVLSSNEPNKPITTDITPPIIETITISFGLMLKFLDIAGGIISKPVISKTPIIFIEIAIIPAISIV